jgi:hypothetical protein
MHYTGLDPFMKEEVYVRPEVGAKTSPEREDPVAALFFLVGRRPLPTSGCETASVELRGG